MKIKVEYIDILRFTRFDTHIVAGTTADFDGLVYNGMFYLIADATPGKWEAPTCFAGYAGPTRFWSGEPTNDIIYVNGRYEGYILPGTFQRDITVVTNWRAPGSSQFRDMIIAEETFHAGQYLGTTSDIVADLWNSTNIIEAVQAQEPFTGATQSEVLEQIEIEFEIAKEFEEKRSELLDKARECAMEEEAKRMAGSSHLMKLDCTYPHCLQ